MHQIQLKHSVPEIIPSVWAVHQSVQHEELLLLLLLARNPRLPAFSQQTQKVTNRKQQETVTAAEGPVAAAITS